MASTQSPIGASVPRPAENGLGRLAAWCYDHRRRMRLARLVLHMLDDPDVGGRLVGLVRAAASEPQAAGMVRELLTREIWAPAAARLRLKRPELVVNLIATQILGLVMARCVVRTEPLASLPTGPAADAFAPALRLLLSGRNWSE
jgi:hypothetical protein